MMFRMARWLKAQGGTSIAVLPQEGAIIDWYARAGIEVRVMPFVEMHRHWTLLYLARYLVSSASIVFRLAALIRECDVDLVHVNEVTYWPGLVAGKLAGARTLCHVRVILEPPAWVRRVLTWLALRCSDQILCVSDAVRTRMFPPAASHVRTLYEPGPDVDRFDPELAGAGSSVREELGLPSGAFVIGLVSKFVASKGHLVLVEAARGIRAQNPGLDLICLFVGGQVAGHEDYFARVGDTIADYGLEDTFVFTGTRDDVPRLVAACDVMVHLPLNEDPFPMVVLEAMALEKPIVAFASGGTPEQFEAGKSGVLVDKNDVAAVAESLLQLAGNAALRRDMGRDGRLFLLSHFSPERFYPELGGIYADFVRTGR